MTRGLGSVAWPGLKCLAEGGPEPSRLRVALGQSIAGEPPKTGGTLVALRRSRLVGADLDLRRPREEGRQVAI
ncbi:MAG TPA: hypothetical protein DDZ81_18545 [Acetobacteraceae bacterium]|nr:hypothetical protein [Acetobacteraceae bacterium]